MIRIRYILFFVLIIFSSCDGVKNKDKKVEALQNQNQLSVVNGDTLETGFWVYDGGIKAVSKSGAYTDGYKTGKWIYRMNGDSIGFTWNIFNEKGVKMNIPDHLKPINDVKLPVLFQADVDDSDDNTYLILLRYNLKEMKSSAYDYIYISTTNPGKAIPKKLCDQKSLRNFTLKGSRYLGQRLRPKEDRSTKQLPIFLL